MKHQRGAGSGREFHKSPSFHDNDEFNKKIISPEVVPLVKHKSSHVDRHSLPYSAKDNDLI
jgi:hypothetical protein